MLPLILEKIQEFTEKHTNYPAEGGGLSLTTAGWQSVEEKKDFSHLFFEPKRSAEEIQALHNELRQIMLTVVNTLKEWTKQKDFKSEWQQLKIKDKQKLLTFSELNYVYLRSQLTKENLQNLVCGEKGERHLATDFLYHSLLTMEALEQMPQLVKAQYGMPHNPIYVKKLNEKVKTDYPKLPLNNLLPAPDYVWLRALRTAAPEVAHTLVSLDLTKPVFLNDAERDNLRQELINQKILHPQDFYFYFRKDWPGFIERQESVYQTKYFPMIERKQIEDNILTPQIGSAEAKKTRKV